MNGPRLSIIPANAVFDKRLTHCQSRILQVLGTHADNKGWCFPSQGKMADRLDVSRVHVNRCIKRLVELGYVEKRAVFDPKSGTRPCFYRVIYDTPCDPDVTGGVTSDVTGGVTSDVTGGCNLQMLHKRPSINDPKNDPENAPPGPISEESSTSFDVQSSSEDIPDPHSGGDIPSLFPENEPTNTPETNHQIILDSWNQLAKHHNVTPASKLTAARKSHINARLKDRDWRNSWREAMKQIPDCPFLVGDNDKGWRADLEWFLRPDSVTKILEGKYTRSKAQPEEEISDSLKEILGHKRGKR